MNIDINKIQENLCQMLCTEIKLYEKNKNLIRVETPFFFPDGNPYQIYIKEFHHVPCLCGIIKKGNSS